MNNIGLPSHSDSAIEMRLGSYSGEIIDYQFAVEQPPLLFGGAWIHEWGSKLNGDDYTDFKGQIRVYDLASRQ